MISSLYLVLADPNLGDFIGSASVHAGGPQTDPVSYRIPRYHQPV